jgi:hypothetical protein
MQDQHQNLIWTATGHERQVFLDPTGRRGRVLRVAAMTLASLALVGPVALVEGASGFSALPSVASQLAAMHRPAHVAAGVAQSTAREQSHPSPSHKTIAA